MKKKTIEKLNFWETIGLKQFLLLRKYYTNVGI